MLVELIHDRKSIWHLKLFYLVVTYTFNMLEKSSQSIFMGYYNDPFIIFDLFDYLILPEWNNSINGILHRLHSWETIARNVLVLLILTWMAEVRKVNPRWCTRVTGSPFVELLL